MTDYNVPLIEKFHNTYSYEDLFYTSLNTSENLKKFYRTLLVSRGDSGESGFVYDNYKSYWDDHKKRNSGQIKFSFDKRSIIPDNYTPKRIYFESVLFLTQLIRYKPWIPSNNITSLEREIIMSGNEIQNGCLKFPVTFPKNQILFIPENEEESHIIGLGYNTEEERSIIQRNIETASLEEYITTFQIMGNI